VSQLSQLFPKQIALAYGCLDRVVIRGYYPALQREDNIIHFFQQVVGLPVVDSGALASRTESYRQWLDAYVQRHAIERFAAPKGARKEDLVQPYYQRLGQQEGIACILTSMEQGTTFVSYEPRFKTKDETYRIIKRCQKRFQHLYFYLNDPTLGQMCLRVGTYLPFSIQCFLNGHSVVAQQLAAQGIRFRKHDNALLSVRDVPALRAAVATLTPQLIHERCDYWARRLAPHFSLAERRDANLSGYAYSVAQVEYAYDTIFRRQVPLQTLFRRLADLGALLGGADRTMTVFGRRIDQRYQGKLMTVLEAADQGHPVLRSYYQTSYVKLYGKPDQAGDDRCLRAEVCLNDPRHLGVQRGLANLPELVRKMTDTAQRYLDLHAELLDTTADAGDLAHLAQPTLRGRRRIPGIRLHDDRVLRLLEVLLQPAGLVADWTVADLHVRVLERYHLSPDDYQPSQLRYDLWKLRAKAIVERVGTSRRYRVTATGLRLGTLLVKLRFRLLGPLVTLVTRPRPRHAAPPDAIEAATRNVGHALDDLFSALALKAAA
jgi:hypothetical protein